MLDGAVPLEFLDLFYCKSCEHTPAGVLVERQGVKDRIRYTAKSSACVGARSMTDNAEEKSKSTSFLGKLASRKARRNKFLYKRMTGVHTSCGLD
jgi:hypothetical protein